MINKQYETINKSKQQFVDDPQVPLQVRSRVTAVDENWNPKCKQIYSLKGKR